MLHDSDKCTRPLPDSARIAGYNSSYGIFNFTSSILYIRDQYNRVIAILPDENWHNGNCTEEHVLVRMVNSITSRHDIVETEKVLKAFLKDSDIALPVNRAQYEDLIRDPRNPSSRHDFQFHSDHIVMKGKIASKGVYYSREANMNFTFDRRQISKPNPNTEVGLSEKQTKLFTDSATHAGVLVKVIDNKMEVRERFYFAGRVEVVVPTLTDEKAEDGVYVTYSSVGDDGALHVTTAFLTFQEAEKEIGLYTTREAARTAGNPDLLLKQEELANRRKIVELESEKLTMHREIENLKRSLEIKRIEVNTDLQAQEVRSAERKRQLEMADMDHTYNHKSRLGELEVSQKKKVAKTEKKLRKEKERMELRLKELKEEQDRSIRQREEEAKEARRIQDALLARIESERKIHESDMLSALKEREREMEYKYNMMQLRRRDMYDEASTNRKDSSELLKYAPLAIGGLIGLLAIINRNK